MKTGSEEGLDAASINEETLRSTDSTAGPSYNLSLELVVTLAEPWEVLGDRHDGPLRSSKLAMKKSRRSSEGRENKTSHGVTMSLCSAGKTTNA